MTYQEIGDELGISRVAAKKRVAKQGKPSKMPAMNPNTYGIPAEEYDQEHYSRVSVVVANSETPNF
ncbi:hypothetical protein NXH67_03935 [Butyrivibrio sp. DSM 10294]|uniref:hypothetical protein n=1 Tax=Butyrivibrio sp. DSM 10294 TaxID=2972457 RepID=UPI00234F17C5|nr:hypothetical protein [Butyrivibrio sp. DSM 10294]MDC7292663.1 hypothetical protein [Butyrivibrio sp. DSM 10294]